MYPSVYAFRFRSAVAFFVSLVYTHLIVDEIILLIFVFKVVVVTNFIIKILVNQKLKKRASFMLNQCIFEVAKIVHMPLMFRVIDHSELSNRRVI